MRFVKIYSAKLWHKVFVVQYYHLKLQQKRHLTPARETDAASAIPVCNDDTTRQSSIADLQHFCSTSHHLIPKQLSLFLFEWQTGRQNDRPTDRPQYSVCSNKPHRRHRRTIQSYSSGGANVLPTVFLILPTQLRFMHYQQISSWMAANLL